MYIWVFPLLFAFSSARDDATFIYSERCDYCYLTKNITINKNYHQIVLLIDGDKPQSRCQTDYLKQCILLEHPTMLIDYHSLHAIKDRLVYPSFGSPRSTTFYMLLQHRSSNVNFSKIFDNYKALWPRSIRPKWLSIDLSGDEDSIESESKYKLPLLHAWRHKFLDFTLVEIKGNNRTEIHHYNPFTNKFTVELFNDDTIIFPDKMHNLHGYKLKTTFTYEPPTLLLEQDEFGDVIKMKGTDYWNILTLAEVLNFDLIVRPRYVNDYVTGGKRISFTQIRDLVYDGKIDFSGNQLYLWGDDSLQLSKQLTPDGQCALVPVEARARIKIPKSFYTILVFSAIYISLMLSVARMMKFNRNSWTWLNMIRVLLGINITNIPSILRERMLLGYIILLSLFYVSDFYSKMTDLKVLTWTVAFRSFDELDKSGLIPLVYYQYFKETFSSIENQSIRNLKNKAQLWLNPASCADLLVLPNNSHFCILPEGLARDMLRKYRREKDGRRRLAIMRPCFVTTWKGYAFTPASPYVGKFDEILQRIGESGLLSHWEKKIRRRRVLVKNAKQSDGKLIELIWILIVGYSVAGSVFILELAFYKWQFLKRIFP